ncbi:putative regulatory protein [Actinoplanes missouriensis 431]|uniref:Putative regulatory protein n=1 Tax=Actinoplanes missouriensis (strain ATCC 14538 / DSM 43046 / CBS 188.64 / JCM 3121 / NBRC 102363 / NCIMB 12654 / NRRL B-3342 / UNCC 431) TaxID=512565 RepID=I0H3C0_ACTM4|nr:NACHT domain-containing protein [Actinoplanes missouriensis]BAL87507.1 putative regulatory protein [Actinoplanes missouriensis 431]
MAATGLEPGVIRAVSKAGQSAFGWATEKRRKKRVRASSLALTNAAVANDVLAELDDEQTAELARFLDSPDFEEIALQVVLARLLDDVKADETRAAVREQILSSLKHLLRPEPHQGTAQADVLFDALLAAAEQLPPAQVESGRKGDAITAATLAHLTASAVAGSRLLQTLPGLVEARAMATNLRRQVAAMHNGMYLPHIGVNRKVPYADLYVPAPMIPAGAEGIDSRNKYLEPDTLLRPSRRFVVLGSPGAGKSTLLSKVAHDVATDQVGDFAGKVPLLLTLRHFEGAFRAGNKTLVDYLEAICRDPYNVEPSPRALEYLLRSGRALVLLDGLDELVDQALRTRVVRLVEGFAHQFPLTPIIVTARVVGYETAPLDAALFDTVSLTEFGMSQVEDYARRWFKLDEATPETQREPLAESFLAESGSHASELRRNPLLLALLCAMYSSEHYIPRNVSQVYERCAVMLFERWDSMRGIRMPLQFRGRVRSAVQYLAWLQLNNSNETALPESRIVQELTEYLERKNLDPDDARATAQNFLDFCTDRSWILTDVGSDTYGFTHRTFMEYFAAEHIVRAHRSSAEIWKILAPKITEGAWDVVGQVAVQLYDRNVEDGADEMLRLILDDPDNDNVDSRSQLLAFAARTLNHVTPTPPTASAIGAKAMSAYLARPRSERESLLPPPGLWDSSRWDLPLQESMNVGLQENVAPVAAGIAPLAQAAIDAGNRAVCYLVDDWSSQGQRPVELAVTAAVRLEFPHEFSASDYFRFVNHRPLALVGPMIAAPLAPHDQRIRDLIAVEPPWFDAQEWNQALQSAYDQRNFMELLQSRLADENHYTAVLLLPYLESFAEKGHPPLDGGTNFIASLISARRGRRVPKFGQTPATDTVAVFLTRWALGEFSVIG